MDEVKSIIMFSISDLEKFSSSLSKDDKKWSTDDEKHETFVDVVNLKSSIDMDKTESTTKKYGLYESEIIFFLKNNEVLSKHSFTFNYDQILKKVYAFHATDLNATEGSLKGATLADKMGPTDIVKQAETETHSNESTTVNPETVSQLEDKIVKTYEQLIEALLNPATMMESIMEIFERLIKENQELKYIDSKNLKLEILMSTKEADEEEETEAFKPNVQKKITIEDYDDYFIMKEKEPHMDDYIQKTYVKALEENSGGIKSSEEEFLQDIWKTKSRESKEIAARRQLNQMLFIKDKMSTQKDPSLPKDENVEGEEFMDHERRTIKSQLQEIINQIQAITESFGEDYVNYEEKKQAILEEAEKVFNQYLDVKLANIQTPMEEDENIVTIPEVSKKTSVRKKRDSVPEATQRVEESEEQKSIKKTRPLSKKTKKSDSVGEVEIENESADTRKISNLEEIAEIDKKPIPKYLEDSTKKDTPDERKPLISKVRRLIRKDHKDDIQRDETEDIKRDEKEDMQRDEKEYIQDHVDAQIDHESEKSIPKYLEDFTKKSTPDERKPLIPTVKRLIRKDDEDDIQRDETEDIQRDEKADILDHVDAQIDHESEKPITKYLENSTKKDTSDERKPLIPKVRRPIRKDDKDDIQRDEKEDIQRDEKEDIQQDEKEDIQDHVDAQIDHTLILGSKQYEGTFTTESTKAESSYRIDYNLDEDKQIGIDKKFIDTEIDEEKVFNTSTKGNQLVDTKTRRQSRRHSQKEAVQLKRIDEKLTNKTIESVQESKDSYQLEEQDDKQSNHLTTQELGGWSTQSSESKHVRTPRPSDISKSPDIEDFTIEIQSQKQSDKTKMDSSIQKTSLDKTPITSEISSSSAEMKQTYSEIKIMAELSRRIQMECERNVIVDDVQVETDSLKYLKNKLGHLLVDGLIDILQKRPSDPCEYLRTYIIENKDKDQARQESRKRAEALYAKKTLLLDIQEELHRHWIEQKNKLKILDALTMDEFNQETIDDMLAVIIESDASPSFYDSKNDTRTGF